jgi:hypothetical protein
MMCSARRGSIGGSRRKRRSRGCSTSICNIRGHGYRGGVAGAEACEVRVACGVAVAAAENHVKLSGFAQRGLSSEFTHWVHPEGSC